MIFTLEKSFPILPEDVYEPLEVSVRGADPEEVDLLTSHPRVSVDQWEVSIKSTDQWEESIILPVGWGSEHKVIKDWGVGRYSDTSAHLWLVNS